MVTVADSAYKADDKLTECVALRGYIILVVGKEAASSTKQTQFPGGPRAVVEWVSEKFNATMQSSFCAELRNQLEAAQASILISAFFEENVAPLPDGSQPGNVAGPRQIAPSHPSVRR